MYAVLIGLEDEVVATMEVAEPRLVWLMPKPLTVRELMQEADPMCPSLEVETYRLDVLESDARGHLVYYRIP